jgi:hypothetical protein
MAVEDPQVVPPIGDQGFAVGGVVPQAPAEPVIVLLGNSAPTMQVKQEDGSTIGVLAEHINQSVTRVEFNPDSVNPEFVERTLSTDNDRILSMIARNLENIEPSIKQWAVAVSEIEQIWAVHSGAGKPSWVASNNSSLQHAIAEHFGIPEGEPTALFTSVGRDALHAQHMGTSAQPAAFFYMGLTASVVAPASSDTTLTGEITTAGGGLLRAASTYAHTTGTNTTTLTKTFTANGSDSLPVTVAQIGVFNASTVGTIAYHTALNATATLSISGDNVTITETVTAG